MIYVEKRQEEFDCIKEKLDWKLLDLYDDKVLNQTANNAILLEMKEDQIIKIYSWTQESILYTRYYWYTNFLVHYEEKYGRDGSMEQEQFKIIEEIDSVIGEVDPALLESIEQELGYKDQPLNENQELFSF